MKHRWIYEKANWCEYPKWVMIVKVGRKEYRFFSIKKIGKEYISDIASIKNTRFVSMTLPVAKKKLIKWWSQFIKDASKYA